MAPASYSEQLERARSAGQGHLFDHYDTLSAEQQKNLVDDVATLDLDYVNSIYKASMEAVGASQGESQPYKDIMTLASMSKDLRKEWELAGLDLIAKGKVAVLLLAGGQGTRLGSTAPKGCYDVGLPSHKSLFQIQAERLRRVQGLAAFMYHGDASRVETPLHWYIMTSPFTHEETVAHFEEHSHFGLMPSQITFFQQGFLPCLTEEGKVVLEAPDKVAKAPDGNGGVYMSLHNAGILDHMEKTGVECLDVFCVDNILSKVCDPVYVGYCNSQGVELGARAIAKASPEERVGVFVSRDGSLSVVEYSELDPVKAAAVDPATGSLYFNWSNICMHYFTLSWLRKVVSHLQAGAAPYHIARKKLPSKDGPVPGIKLELFIFDAFATADKVALFEVARASEFAPVKNAPGSPTDSPDTARAAVMSLCASWVAAAGGIVEGEGGIEVSPLLSYNGEDLIEHCEGKHFKAGGHLEL